MTDMRDTLHLCVRIKDAYVTVHQSITPPESEIIPSKSGTFRHRCLSATVRFVVSVGQLASNYPTALSRLVVPVEQLASKCEQGGRTNRTSLRHNRDIKHPHFTLNISH